MKKRALVVMMLSSLALSGCIVSVGAHDFDHSQLQKQSKQLELKSIDQIERLEINAGRGGLKVIGDDNISTISVDADIASEDGKDYILSLTQEGNAAKLVAKTDGGIFENSHASVDLTVRVPSHLLLNVNDGSGDISIVNIKNNVLVNDGSGSISVSKVKGSLEVNDGSGDIRLLNIGNNVTVNDGSGSISLNTANGFVDIRDGSGDINVSAVTGNVTVNDGSGSTSINNITGNVRINDGSGDINVKQVVGKVRVADGSGSITVDGADALMIESDGSGDVNTRNIRDSAAW